jgi:AbrB family looped-hinge helix DNA binding protein
MKALGIVRKIDDLGRVVVPKEVRDTQGWKSGQALEMFMSDEGLVIKGYHENEEKEQAIKVLQSVLPSLTQEGQAQLKSVLAYLEK